MISSIRAIWSTSHLKKKKLLLWRRGEQLMFKYWSSVEPEPCCGEKKPTGGPSSPASPFSPDSPAAPRRPASPCRPGGPPSPLTPLGPSLPGGPAGPAGPGLPWRQKELCERLQTFCSRQSEGGEVQSNSAELFCASTLKCIQQQLQWDGVSGALRMRVWKDWGLLGV